MKSIFAATISNHYTFENLHALPFSQRSNERVSTILLALYDKLGPYQSMSCYFCRPTDPKFQRLVVGSVQDETLSCVVINGFRFNVFSIAAVANLG